MPDSIQNFCSEIKRNFYPRDTGASVCHLPFVNGESNLPRARGRDIRPPSVTMEWDQRAFVRRVMARAAQLNATMEGLSKAAGGSGHELNKVINPTRKLGPTAGSLFFVATALHWTIGQVMGIQDPTLDLRREREVDPRKLRVALYLADRATETDMERDDARYANIASAAYSIVSEREAAGRSIELSDLELFEDVVSLLRHL